VRRLEAGRVRRAIVVGCGVNGLGVIRSLGTRGVAVLALDYDATSFGQASKYVVEKSRVPHPVERERAFVEQLLGLPEPWSGSALFAAGDIALVGLARNREELGTRFRVLAPDSAVLRTFIDKPSTYRLAERVGVPHPATLFPADVEALHTLRDRIRYPSLLKPVRGHELMAAFNVKTFEVADFDAAVEAFQRCARAGVEVMVQEVIPGPDSAVYECAVYIDREGRTRASFVSRKLRQNPPGYGVARVAVSEPPDPRLREHTETLLSAAGFRGIAHVEFKRHPHDGGFRLLEVNARTQRSNWLATRCGVNLPWLAYRDHLEDEREDVSTYAAGVYWVDAYQDLINTLFRGRREDLRWRDYTEPYRAGRKTYAVLSRSDPGPAVKQLTVLPIKYARYFRYRAGRGSRSDVPAEVAP
jgi:D-aspartate ligase